MLPLVLVLLGAHGALSAPSISVSQVSSNQFPWQRDNGAPVNGYLIEQVFGLLDTGDISTYSNIVLNNLAEMGASPDPASQALALGQTINVLGELAAGTPGDACEYAAVANAHASGNPLAVAQALGGYVNRLIANINAIAQLNANPAAARSIVGLSSGCAGGGRIYQFEQVWDSALANANPYTIGLLNEQYCTARRLYGSHTAVSSNIAAGLSASAVSQVQQLLEANLLPLSNTPPHQICPTRTRSPAQSIEYKREDNPPLGPRPIS